MPRFLIEPALYTDLPARQVLAPNREAALLQYRQDLPCATAGSPESSAVCRVIRVKAAQSARRVQRHRCAARAYRAALVQLAAGLSADLDAAMERPGVFRELSRNRSAPPYERPPGGWFTP